MQQQKYKEEIMKCKKCGTEAGMFDLCLMCEDMRSGLMGENISDNEQNPTDEEITQLNPINTHRE